MVVSISSIDTLDLFSAILSAVGGGDIGAIVADSRLGSSLYKITVRFIPTASPKRAFIIPLVMDGTGKIFLFLLHRLTI